MPNRCSSGFAGESTAPIIAGESPADLDCRREGRFEIVKCEADKADKFGFSGYLDCPKPIAVRDETSFDAIRKGIGLRSVEHAREVLHDCRIRIEAGERLLVTWPPMSQQKALGTEVAD
jgi:hypothetical protein